MQPSRICSTSHSFPSNSTTKPTHRRPICYLPSINDETAPKLLESRLVGLRQLSDGTVEECAVEHLLLLRGADGIAPSRVPLATFARIMAQDAANFARDEVTQRLAQTHRQRILNDLTLTRWTLSTAASTSRRLNSQQPDPILPKGHALVIRHANRELTRVKEQQRSLTDLRNRRLAELQTEPDLIQAGEMEFLIHALVVPVQDTGETERYDADVETIAVKGRHRL